MRPGVRALCIVLFSIALAVPTQAADKPAEVKTRAQTPAKQGAGQTKTVRMTNQDVIDMVAGGLSDSLVISSVRRTNNPAFDLSAKGMLALKNAGVSEAVIAVMLDPTASVELAPQPKPVPNIPTTAKPGQDQAGATKVADPSDVTQPHPPGIYVDLASEGGGLVQIEANRYSGGKTGGIFKSVVTAGIAKAKWKAILSGPRANQRIGMPQPTYYFYFEVTNAGLSGTGSQDVSAAATSPNEFVFARLSVTRAGRELIIGQGGSFGSSTGVRGEDTIDVKIEKLAPGIFRVRPIQPVPPGEYCIFHAGAMAAVSGGAGGGMGRLFDFGIDLK